MITCQLCNKNTFNKTKYFVSDQEIIKCKKCGFLRLNYFKQEYDKDLYQYYEDYSKTFRSKEWKQRAKLNLINLSKSLKDYSYRYNSNKKNISLLDFGCGLGLTLDTAKKLDWEVKGVEMNEFCINFCEKKNHKVYSYLSEIDENIKFDIITLFDVVEHVPNPTNLLKDLKTKLSKDGFLIITCPNWNSLERIFFQNNWKAIDPQHYHYFTIKTMMQILQKANFKIIQIKTKNFNPFQNKQIKNNQPSNKIKATTLRSFLSKGLGFLIKKIFNFFLNFFSLGSTLEVICK